MLKKITFNILAQYLYQCYSTTQLNSLANLISINLPDVIAFAFTYDDHESIYLAEIKKAINITALYEYIKTIPINKNINYGWVGYVIF